MTPPPDQMLLRIDEAESGPLRMTVSCPAPGFSPESLQLHASCVNLSTRAARDVTGEVSWRVGDSSFLVISTSGHPGELRARCPLPYGGKQLVRAEGACGYIAAQVELSYDAPDIFVGKEPPRPDWFDGPVSPRAEDRPVVLYPLDGAVHPSNIARIDLQWRSPGPKTRFRLAFTGVDIRRAIYLDGSGACVPDPRAPETVLCRYQPDPAVLASLLQSPAGGDVTLLLTGVEGAHGTQAIATPLLLRTTPERLRVDVVFADADDHAPALRRARTGVDRVTTPFHGGTNPLRCAGCHALTADGKRLAATASDLDGVGVILDANTGRTIVPAPGMPASQRWTSATFSPDGKLLLTGWAGQLTLRDGLTGARKYDVDRAITSGRAIQPAWSPDGTQVAFVRVPEGGKLGRDFIDSRLQAGDWVAGNTGDIAVMRYESGAFQPARTIVPSTPGVEYHYYPTFSPGSDYLAFVTASAPGQSPYAWPMIYGRGATAPPAYRDYVMTYGQASTRLRLVPLDAGDPAGDPVDLAAATHIEGSSVAWPRFLPVQQADLAFLGFSARLPYGFVVGQGTVSQVWLAAVDLARARSPGGADPSFPPVWLPYQDPRFDSYGAAWSVSVGCEINEDCETWEFCIAGTCESIHPGNIAPPVEPR